MGLFLPDVAGLTLVDAARAYARAGIPVFPLATRTKRPIFMGGFNQASTDPATIDAWWATHPEANIGAVPGLIGCIVPDIDTADARAAWHERVIVETASTETGGGVGVHPWYRSEALSRRSHWRLDEHGGPFQDDRLANLLFRAAGGYVVVAPSIHPDTGDAYRLVEPGTPISDLPTDIEQALLTIPSREAGGGHALDKPSAQQWLADHSRTMSEGGQGILNQRIANIIEAPKDTRNDTLMAEVGVLLNSAYTWAIDMDAAREQIRDAYVPHVADTRKSRDANREVDQAFDYIATQRHWEGPLEEAVGGIPVKPSLQIVKPKSPEDRLAAKVEELKGGGLDIPALVRGETPEVDWLVEGIIPRSRLVAFVATAKAGKSLLMLDIVASMAVGRPLFGKAHGPFRVLYVDYEMTPDDVSARLQDLGFVGDDEATTLLLAENLIYLQTPPMEPLDTSEGGAVLTTLASDLKVDLVVIDTMAAAVAGPENDSDTYRAARHHTWTPLKAQGIGVVRVDHLGKNKSAGARGSSMKRDDVDLEWELTQTGGRGTNARLLLKSTFSRLPGMQDITLERLDGPLRHVRVGSHIWTTSAISLAQAMRAANIDPSGPGKLNELLRQAGISFSNHNLTEARRYIEEGMPTLGPDLTSKISDPRGAEATATEGEPPPPGDGASAPLPSPAPRALRKKKLGGIEQIEIA